MDTWTVKSYLLRERERERELHSTSAVPTREYGFGRNEVDWASANPQYTHLWLIE